MAWVEGSRRWSVSARDGAVEVTLVTFRRFRDSPEIARDAGLARFFFLFCCPALAKGRGARARGGYLEHADVVLGEDIEGNLVGLPRVSESGTVEGGRARGVESRTFDRRRRGTRAPLKSVRRNDIQRGLPSALARSVRGSWGRREPDARIRAHHHLDGHLAGRSRGMLVCCAARGVTTRRRIHASFSRIHADLAPLAESDFGARAKNAWSSHSCDGTKRHRLRASAATLLRGRREWSRPRVRFT